MADLPKRTLNDQFIRSLKPAPKGKPYAAPDALVPGFKLKVSHTGRKTGLVWACWNGSKNPSARTIGDYPMVPLAEMRRTARLWQEMRANGQDPKRHKPGGNTFGVLMEQHLALHVSRQRRAKQTEREIRRELSARWKDRAIGSIDRVDVVRLIDEMKARGVERQVHNVYGHLRAFYNWLIERSAYGITSSPCDRLRPKRVIGAKRIRETTLTDDEVRAVWQAADRMGYPWGHYFKLVLLTGSRRSEVGGMRWNEVDLEAALWRVPAARFKMGRMHVVPLSADAMAILHDLPRWEGSDVVFSASAGRSPITTYSKAMDKLRAVVASDLGSEPAFQLHDFRRTMRTGMAACGVRDEVAELVIGHAKQGLQRVYDQHSYQPEMRQALERWSRRLRAIVTPGDKVVRLERAG
jgi:integrase